MSTATAEFVEEQVAVDDGDALTHTYCCDPTVALCGADLGDAVDAVDPLPADECVVCTDVTESTVPVGSSSCVCGRAA